MQLFEQPITIEHKWIPAVLPDMDKYKSNYTLKLKAGEKKIFRKKKPMRCSVWAERHRVVTRSSIRGPWRNSNSPYLAGIMDASFFESVETVIVCAATQVGKTEVVNNCIGYCMDRRPGSVLYIYPDENTARTNSKDRIAEMIQTSPKLSEYLTGTDDDVSFDRINLIHMEIYTGWARSAARLANKPLPYVVFDEVDKYPETAGKKEAAPMALGEKRTRTFSSMRKIWKISTPTTEEGPIWTALNTEASVIFDYWVECPACGGMQVMVFDEDHFKFPEDERDPEKVIAKKLAWYECDSCGSRWDEGARDEAVRNGEWRGREKGKGRISNDEYRMMNDEGKDGLELMEYLQAHRPLKIGFHLPAWLSHFVTLSEVAGRFMKGLKDKTALKDFMNSDCAEPWKVYEIERQEDQILALRDDRPRGVVPGGGIVACLTAAVDTQDDGFYYEIRAWGYGMEKESWCIREGFVTEFDALVQVLWQDRYEDGDGNPYIVRLVLHDAMGHRTSEVYDFCRIHRGKILPIKGEQRMNQPFAYTNLEYYPGKSQNKPIPGGLKLVRVNTNYYKNDLSNILEVPAADPGAWHYHSETTEDWARQMTAEYIDEKGLWQLMASRANHAWDVSVYNLCAHDVLGVKFWPKGEGSGFKVQGSEAGRKVRSKGIGREGWIRNYERPGWLKDR